MAFGCGDDGGGGGTGGGTGGVGGGTGGTGGGTGGTGGGTGGTGGSTGPTCTDTACLFCPASALDPTVGALFPDGLNVPITFTAEPQTALTQGGTSTVDIVANSAITGLPVSVEATLADTSTTTYDVTAGGSGTADIAVPAAMLSGTDLNIDAGAGTLDATADADATDLTIQLTSAVFDLSVTSPVPLDLTLDASPTGPCMMLGDGVTNTVGPAM